MDDKDFLLQAIQKSDDSVRLGGFPVGAVIVQNDTIISSAISDGKNLKDPTCHAEIAAIRSACQQLQNRDLKHVTLYSSLEPCLMCYAACFWASIPRLVYACSRDKASSMHYEGKHDMSQINQATRHPIELVHLSELEQRAVEIIDRWEANRKSNHQIIM